MNIMIIQLFTSKKEKGQFFCSFFLFNPLSMLVIESFENQYEEQQKTIVASPILNIQSCELFIQVTIPIRRMFARQ